MTPPGESPVFDQRQGIFDEYRWIISRVQWLLDGIVVVLLLFLICWFYGETFRFRWQALGLVTFLLTVMGFRAARLYQPWRGANFFRLLRRVFLTWLVLVALLMTLGYFTKTSIQFSRKVLLTWMVTVPVALVVLRLQIYWGLRWLRQQGRNSRTMVIAGAGDLGRRLAKNVVDTPWLGMLLLGFFDDRVTGKIHLDHQGYPVLGTLDDLTGFVKEHQVAMVYLALPLRAEERLRAVVDSLQDTTASLYYVPDVFIFSLMSASFTDLLGLPLIALWETPFFGVNGWLKRAEDLVLAGLILILMSPLLVVIALGVKLSSPGPVIFRQRRYGLDGHEIMVYKFRTMRVCEDGPEVPQATKDDDRVTPFGRFLRRTSLDELPQFVNVLQGSMSIVGPRPHAVAHNEYYRRLIPGYMLRHKVRPGLTGWAQINGWRGETETLEKMEKRVEYDLDYLRRWSLWFDIKIILLTIFRGFKDSHAY
jgi:putative colanic acid biosynthesis UDP-glucose lipid carrier transferase